MAKQKPFVLTERTYLTAAGKAVPAGHPDGVVVLGAAGKVIPGAEAERYGLVKGGGGYPLHTGGGWYELSDGSRVKGKADAAAAEKALQPGANKAADKGADK